jgi:hypothetical protein
VAGAAQTVVAAKQKQRLTPASRQRMAIGFIGVPESVNVFLYYTAFIV